MNPAYNSDLCSTFRIAPIHRAGNFLIGAYGTIWRRQICNIFRKLVITFMFTVSEVLLSDI